MLDAENESQILEIGVIHPFRQEVTPNNPQHTSQLPQPGDTNPQPSTSEDTNPTTRNLMGPIPSRSRAEILDETLVTTPHGFATTRRSTNGLEGQTLQINDVRHDPEA